MRSFTRWPSAPGETGEAEFLVEGLKEGTHVVEILIDGVLNGLPIGPTPIESRASGTVLVRNPDFALTFTHPAVVRSGEEFNLDVTVTNTSSIPANLVSISLFRHQISGALLKEESPTVRFEEIPPGESVLATFRLESQKTGHVTATSFLAEEGLTGSFSIRAGVGDAGIPLSPNTLLLPPLVHHLDKEVVRAATRLLGLAHGVATAPPGSLPPEFPGISLRDGGTRTFPPRRSSSCRARLPRGPRRGSYEARVTVGTNSIVRPARSEVPAGYIFSPWNLSVADSSDPEENRWLGPCARASRACDYADSESVQNQGSHDVRPCHPAPTRHNPGRGITSPSKRFDSPCSTGS